MRNDAVADLRVADDRDDFVHATRLLDLRAHLFRTSVLLRRDRGDATIEFLIGHIHAEVFSETRHDEEEFRSIDRVRFALAADLRDSMLNARFIDAAREHFHALLFDRARRLFFAQLRWEFKLDTSDELISDLFTHRGALLAIATLLKRVTNLFDEKFFGLHAKHLSEFLVRTRSDAFSLTDRVAHIDGLSAEFFAFVAFSTSRRHRDSVADALAEQRFVEAIKDESEQRALAFVFLRRNNAESLIGFEEDTVFACDGHDGLAEHAVKMLKRSFEACGRTPAVTLTKNLAVDVLLRHIDGGLLHLVAREIWHCNLWRDFDFDGEGEGLSALQISDDFAGHRARFADRTQFVFVKRALVRIAHDLATSFVQQICAELLLDESTRRLALAESWDSRFACKR